MAGDKGQLKTTYQLGEKGQELHFTLLSASFARRYAAADDNIIAGAGERLLILNFTVQNPLKTEMQVSSNSFHFTVVSPDDENFEYRGSLLNTTKKTNVDQTLKPAQKVKCTVVIPIYGQGEVPKVIVQRGSAPVLRYDLTKKVDKMTTAFSTDGYDLTPDLKDVALGKPLDMAGFDVTIDDMSYSTAPLRGYKPSDNGQYLIVKVSFTNPMLKPISLGFQYFTPELFDATSKSISWNRDIYTEATDESLGQEVPPGVTVKGRYFFTVPANVNPKTLKFTHNSTKVSASFAAPGK